MADLQIILLEPLCSIFVTMLCPRSRLIDPKNSLTSIRTNGNSTFCTILPDRFTTMISGLDYQGSVTGMSRNNLDGSRWKAEIKVARKGWLSIRHMLSKWKFHHIKNSLVPEDRFAMEIQYNARIEHSFEEFINNREAYTNRRACHAWKRSFVSMLER